MLKGSPELARRIDAMLSHQNGEPMQYRNKGSRKWSDLSERGGLSFNWDKCDFRKKPVLIKGWVDPIYVHTSGVACAGLGCIQVQQVVDDE